MPFSVVITCLLKFGIQFLLLIGIWFYYLITSDTIHPQKTFIFFPLLILCMALLGLGFGMIISSLTTKYRDFTFLIGFGVQLAMYASPIVYPISIVPDQFKWLIMLNPMSSIIEVFKHGLLGQGSFDPYWLVYSSIFSIIIFLIGIFIFNKVEKSFIDTV